MTSRNLMKRTWPDRCTIYRPEVSRTDPHNQPVESDPKEGTLIARKVPCRSMIQERVIYRTEESRHVIVEEKKILMSPEIEVRRDDHIYVREDHFQIRELLNQDAFLRLSVTEVE